MTRKPTPYMPTAIVALALLAGCGQPEPPAARVTSELLTGPGADVSEDAAAPAKPVSWRQYDASGLPPTGGRCALDVVNGAPAADAVVQAGAAVAFGGWVASADDRVPDEARLVLIAASGAYSAPVTGGVVRPDVAEAFNAAGLASSGFDLVVTMDVVPGSYEVAMVHWSGEATATCRLNASLTVQG